MIIKAVVEMPQGSYLKYEHDKENSVLVVDRVLNQPIPHVYGYIPDTLCDDGDPLDIFILGNNNIYPLTQVRAEIVGILKCMDNGKQDDKIIATLQGDVIYFGTSGLDNVISYLQSYKEGFVVQKTGSKEEALEVYNASKALFSKTNEA